MVSDLEIRGRVNSLPVQSLAQKVQGVINGEVLCHQINKPGSHEKKGGND